MTGSDRVETLGRHKWDIRPLVSHSTGRRIARCRGTFRRASTGPAFTGGLVGQKGRKSWAEADAILRTRQGRPVPQWPAGRPPGEPGSALGAADGRGQAALQGHPNHGPSRPVSVDGCRTGTAVKSGRIGAASQQYRLRNRPQGVDAVAGYAQGGVKAPDYTRHPHPPSSATSRSPAPARIPASVSPAARALPPTGPGLLDQPALRRCSTR